MDMMQAMSNLVATRPEVQTSSEEARRAARDLYRMMEEYGCSVQLNASEPHEMAMDNVHLVVRRVDPGQQQELQFQPSFDSADPIRVTLPVEALQRAENTSQTPATEVSRQVQHNTFSKLSLLKAIKMLKTRKILKPYRNLDA